VSLRLRRVTLDDLAAVRAIEAEAFADGWPPTAFEHELTKNGAARYLLLERVEEAGPRAVGFAGLWLMLDEAHVVTVAVLPAERGRGYGRVLAHALLAIAEDAGMQQATLEVRVSNLPARALYRAYGFHDVGQRRRYYPDGEDAVIMTTEPFASPRYRERLRELEAVLRGRFPGLFGQPFEPASWGFA
jgi:ribosomal-protein-alanine N-acetyltransferase